MQIFSFILLGLLALSIAMLSVFFVYVIRKNMRQGRIFRRNLAQTLQHLRMSKVLAALGLDFDVYLHKSSIQNIQQNMSKCENCTTTDACDEKLSQQSIQHAEIQFCPISENFFQFSTLDGPFKPLHN